MFKQGERPCYSFSVRGWAGFKVRRISVEEGGENILTYALEANVYTEDKLIAYIHTYNHCSTSYTYHIKSINLLFHSLFTIHLTIIT